MSKPICSVDDCEREIASRGLCDKHYKRWRRHGSPDIKLSNPGRKPLYDTCTVSDCDRGHWAKGFCSMHYRRWKKHGSPYPQVRVCSIPECERPHSARGFCGTHYERFRKHGSPDVALTGGTKWRDVVTYTSAHQRIYTVRGAASEWSCSWCARPAEEWMLVGIGECVSETGLRYSTDIDAYIPACCQCHRERDSAMKLDRLKWPVGTRQ